LSTSSITTGTTEPLLAAEFVFDANVDTADTAAHAGGGHLTQLKCKQFGTKEIDFGLEFGRCGELAGFHGGKHASIFFVQFAGKLLKKKN
jgi:hypothetical protein